MSKLTFYGGAQEVTGANYLLETDGGAKILIDCGLFQCPGFCRSLNQDKFEYDPAEVDALFVTHGHIDHLGRVPKLVHEGFKGKIYSTPPTKDFGAIMLEDSMGILGKEAEREKRKPIYDLNDVEATKKLWEGIPYGESVTTKDVTVTVRNAGHILGSAIYEFKVADKKLVFTGDLGNTPMPLLPPPDKVTGADYLVIESAYGDREHEDITERKGKLEGAIEDVVKRNGTLIIPSFALERTQEILFELNDLVENGRIPRVPIFIDSPLAIKATTVYKKYENYFSKSAQNIIKSGDDLFKFPGLHMTLKTEQSKAIKDQKGSKIILAGAGMMHGGRIVHHAREYLPGKDNMILFIGYQAAGSPGRRILEGEKEVRITGEMVPVRAEVRKIRGYSAHADTNALFEFIQNNAETLKKVFVVQGEAKASLFLAQRARDHLGLDAIAPELGYSFEF
ncbi:MAG: MBL fold metallo-hydrolase [bacterium]|nr:MBL fold metallo-hydrolase [bacterium]